MKASNRATSVNSLKIKADGMKSCQLQVLSSIIKDREASGASHVDVIQMSALQSCRSFGKRGPGSFIALCEDSLTRLGLFTRLLRLRANVYGLPDSTGRSSVGSHK